MNDKMPSSRDVFERAGSEKQRGLFGELFLFMKDNKKNGAALAESA